MKCENQIAAIANTIIEEEEKEIEEKVDKENKESSQAQPKSLFRRFSQAVNPIQRKRVMSTPVHPLGGAVTSDLEIAIDPLSEDKGVIRRISSESKVPQSAFSLDPNTGISVSKRSPTVQELDRRTSIGRLFRKSMLHVNPQSFLSDISQGSTRRIRISQPNMPRNSGTDIPIGLNRASGSFASLSQDLDYPLTWKEKLEDCLDSKAMQIVSFTFTVLALFLNFIRILLLPPSVDSTIEMINFILFLFFLIEFIQFSVIKPGYFGRTLFFLDLLAIFSICLDISWLSPMDDLEQDLAITRLGRTARVGARIGRLTRLLRIARLMRVVRVFRIFRFIRYAFPRYFRQHEDFAHANQSESENQGGEKKRKGKKSMSKNVSAKHHVLPNQFQNDAHSGKSSHSHSCNQQKKSKAAENTTKSQLPNESPETEYPDDEYENNAMYIGSLLADSVSKKIVVVMLSLVLFMSFYEEDSLQALQDKRINELDTVQTMIQQFGHNSSFSESLISKYIKQNEDVIYLQIENITYIHIKEDYRDYYRTSDIQGLKTDDYTESWIDQRKLQRNRALLNIILTSFVVFLLVATTYSFVNDMEHLIVSPVKHMIRNQQKLDALLDVFKAFHVDLENDSDAGDAIRHVLTAICKLIRCQTLSFYFVNSIHRQMRCAISTSQLIQGRVIPNDKGITGFVSQTGEHVNLSGDHLRSHHLFDPNIDGIPGVITHSFLCTALYDANGNLFAVIQCLNKVTGAQGKMSFTEDDESVLEAFIQELTTILRKREQEEVFRAVTNSTNVDSDTKEMLMQFNKPLSRQQSSKTETRRHTLTPDSIGSNSKWFMERDSLVALRIASMGSLSNFDLSEVNEDKKLAELDVVAEEDEERTLDSILEESEREALEQTESKSVQEHSRQEKSIKSFPEQRDNKQFVHLSSIDSQEQNQLLDSSPRNESIGDLTDLKMDRNWRKNSDFSVVSRPPTNLGGIQIDVLSWDLWIWELNHEQLCGIVPSMLASTPLLSHFRIPTTQLKNFIRAIAGKYQPVPYHNWYHAFNVFHTSFLITRNAQSVPLILTLLDLLALFIAALAHDVDHPGLNNEFGKKTSSEHAITYNDISILENHHAATCFRILQNQSCNVFVKMPREDIVEIRKSIIAAILATDMTHHVDAVSKLSVRQSIPFNGSNVDDRQQLVNAIVHAADIGNPVLPWRISRKFAESVAEEFRGQVAKEREMHLPISTFMDVHGEIGLAKLNLGFIDYIVSPLWDTLQHMLPELQDRTTTMLENRDNWRSIIDNEQEEQQ